jgi:hypothetical protein
VKGVERHGIARLIGGTPKHFANSSTRARVAGGDAAEIAGFIVTGEAPKQLIIRALGPSLASSGVPASETLADPTLTLHDASGSVIAQNDNWRATQAQEISDSGIPPGDDREAALIATVQPGSYTAIVTEKAGGEGLALVEVYDLNPAPQTTLANISTRAVVGEGENILIGGFILRGSEQSNVIVRALGPSLATSGVTDPLSDPAVILYDESGAIVAANDDWKETQQAELHASGMAPSDDREAAVLTALAPGAYTAVLRGAEGRVGVGLIELYRY